ncbi:magnesium-translocating P-type ATPase [Pseudonocardia sp. GCM10023141]|uniref:magnesium-translocating P-type ATPase n=1 Tax=Pseudonocardia sp. GCM10023141 TaxID=3252653 RepID=UPI003613A17F
MDTAVGVQLPPVAARMTAADAAARGATDVLTALATGPTGLSTTDVTARRAAVGPNAVRSHHARPLAVLGRQLRSALLVLLLVTAAVSYLLGERTDAVIIGVILAASVGLGFVNEYRAERAAEALHTAVRYRVVVLRDAVPVEVAVTDLVPGDVVRLAMGEVVPADLRLLETTGLECNESVLTGETAAAAKDPAPVAPGAELAELSSCALMGTVVQAGSGTGVVVATGARTAFGRIAVGLGERQPETEFQVGLRRYSMLLLYVALVLSAFILATNVLLARPLLDALLFSLAIAVGITPQLLPAVVSMSLATGSRRLARHKVLVKRLVCIEDLGDMDVLVTDKTGTLTEGSVSFSAALDAAGAPSDEVFRKGLLATESEGVGGNPLDAALWAAAATPAPAGRRIGTLPFDHDRRMVSVLIDEPSGGPLLVVKGAPETVLARCTEVPPAAAATLRSLFADGSRVIAVASRSLPATRSPAPDDEHDLTLDGFLVFLDRPKADAGDALRRLAALGIAVKVATGDNALVAEKVCAELGLVSGGTLVGTDIEAMDDEHLTAAAETATIFARVAPEQKARIIRLLRTRGRDVGFLGDGVNDALALHAADIGISVDTATDVAKDAADVLLLEKDLGVLAGGVAEGRRTFANTIKYVLMGTSSNFGNMFSAAGAAAILPFLPMLPSQILLTNLLYDAGQLSIPTDNVDDAQMRAPSHWDLHMIRRFMLFFGPVSSLFDFLTFGIMLGALHAGPDLFRSGWFVESLATQTLVIFAIRTRRVPFLRSRPSTPLTCATLAVVAVGVALPFTPLAGVLGFQPLPPAFLAVLAGLIVVYLILIEVAKTLFYSERVAPVPDRRRRDTTHRIHRRASRFSHRGPLADR